MEASSRNLGLCYLHQDIRPRFGVVMRDTCVGLQALVPLCKSLLGAQHTAALLGTGYGEGIFLRSAERLSLLAGAHPLTIGCLCFLHFSEVSSAGFPHSIQILKFLI